MMRTAPSRHPTGTMSRDAIEGWSDDGFTRVDER